MTSRSSILYSGLQDRIFIYESSVMNSTIPADLLELKARFETWRTNRKYVREPILRSAPLGGESERTFFTFFKLGCRKHTAYMTNSMPPLLPAIVGTGEGNR